MRKSVNLLGLALAGIVLGATLSNCGATPKSCSTTTCGGCCTSAGECVTSTSAQQCGAFGGACVSCFAEQTCSAGFCANTGTGGSSGGGAGGGSGGGNGATSLRVFITSVEYQGNFGGPVAADAICTQAAEAANKGGTWKAWLSTSSTSAISRVPDTAGPWHQALADGGTILTFNNKANWATTPRAPIDVDEHGRTAGSYWTGTALGGTSTTTTCAEWTSTSVQGTGGVGDAENERWTSYGTLPCGETLSFLCFETSNQPAPVVRTGQKRLFVTSTRYTGNLGGLTGADAKCTTAAQAANKGGTWVAWLSSTTTSALSRVPAGSGPWYQTLPNGTTERIFNNRANLASTPLAPIAVDEFNARVTTPMFWGYWTGMWAGGIDTTDMDMTCENWTTASRSWRGIVGRGADTNWTWTSAAGWGCDEQYALLCLEL